MAIHDAQKKIIYLAYNNPVLHPGINKKILQTVSSFRLLGYKADALIISPPKGWHDLRMVRQILATDAEIIIFRSHPWMLPCAFALAIQRLARKKIIIDVPTPYQAAWQEIKINYEHNKIKMIAALSVMALTFPCCLWPAHKIIQYAPDSRYFSIGLKGKTELHANGIESSHVPVRVQAPSWPAAEFTMIAVGRLAPWHGFDRLIHGIAIHQNKFRDVAMQPRLIIVGDGPIRRSWEQLAHSLAVSDRVAFVGYQNGEDLDAMFAQSHIAISSLGLFRKNLDIASDLKSREYTARGMPFVAAANDMDFNPIPWFVFQVANSDTPLDIRALIEWYGRISTRVDLIDAIRLFAEQRLDFKQKAEAYLS